MLRSSLNSGIDSHTKTEYSEVSLVLGRMLYNDANMWEWKWFSILRNVQNFSSKKKMAGVGHGNRSKCSKDEQCGEGIPSRKWNRTQTLESGSTWRLWRPMSMVGVYFSRADTLRKVADVHMARWWRCWCASKLSMVVAEGCDCVCVAVVISKCGLNHRKLFFTILEDRCPRHLLASFVSSETPLFGL